MATKMYEAYQSLPKRYRKVINYSWFRDYIRRELIFLRNEEARSLNYPNECSWQEYNSVCSRPLGHYLDKALQTLKQKDLAYLRACQLR